MNVLIVHGMEAVKKELSGWGELIKCLQWGKWIDVRIQFEILDSRFAMNVWYVSEYSSSTFSLVRWDSGMVCSLLGIDSKVLKFVNGFHLVEG